MRHLRSKIRLSARKIPTVAYLRSAVKINPFPAQEGAKPCYNKARNSLLLSRSHDPYALLAHRRRPTMPILNELL